MAQTVPSIDVAALFGPPSDARRRVDGAMVAAGQSVGLMQITGFPADIRIGAPTRHDLLRLFRPPRPDTAALSYNRDDPTRPLRYRGWFGFRAGRAFHYEGMEIGADIAHGPERVDPADPLLGATPMPSESELPGWRAAVRDYCRAMERVADAVIRATARGLGIPEEGLAPVFVGGMSSLRLLRYPVRSADERARVPAEDLYVRQDGVQREVINEAHTDFGFLTLLNQDGTEGFQARMPDGRWVDVPPVEGHLVVNFGKLFERCTGGRIRATEHRVLSPGRERFSLPFFYEPRVDAEIGPLPLAGVEPFAPFLYGDHAWASIPRLGRLFGERRVARKPR